MDSGVDGMGPATTLDAWHCTFPLNSRASWPRRRAAAALSVEVLAREALERAVGYDDWFISEVETGLSQVDAGQTLTHDAVGERLAKKLAEHDARR